MLFPTAIPIIDVDIAPSAAQIQEPHRESIADEITVEWRSKRIQLDPRIVSFEGGIKATFGPTILYADSLVLNYETKEGKAMGTVRLVDPDGTMEASNLEFNWVERTGHADDAQVETVGAMLHVRRLEISPQQWLLYDAKATICKEENPKFWFRSSLTTIRPGRNGRAKNLSLELYGAKLPKIPVVSFSLDKRVTGLRLPAVSFRKGVGLGIAWSSSFLLQERLSLTAQNATFPGLSPSYGAMLTYNFLPPEKAFGLVAPRNELGERFADSYMDNIQAVSPAEEDAYLREQRQTFSAATNWNQATKGRFVDSTNVSKAFELIGELGGALGPIGGVTQIRAQSIRPSSREPFSQRGIVQGSANLVSFRVGPGLSFRLRADGSSFWGDSTYGWIRGQGSLVAEINPKLRIAVGYSQVLESGTPQFSFDRLSARRSYDLRGDVKLGPLTLSALFRYDLSSRKWYDRQYSISLIAGCFEPYLVVKQNPSETNFGVKFRIDAILGRLQRRNVTRTSKAPAETPSKMDHSNGG